MSRPADQSVSEASHFSPGPATGADGVDRAILAVLGTKILHAWLRTQHQLLFPLTLAIERIDESARDHLAQAAVAAALSDGIWDSAKEAQVDNGLRPFLANPQSRADAIVRARVSPWPLHAVLAADDIHAAGLIYAAVLAGTNRRSSTGRMFTRYVVARLRLPDELARSLERRYQD